LLYVFEGAPTDDFFLKDSNLFIKAIAKLIGFILLSLSFLYVTLLFMLK